MTEGDRPVYCAQCGDIIQAGDSFCGVCGAEIPPDAQDAAPTEEIPTQVHAPQGITARSGNRKRLLAIAIGTLLVLLVGTGAVAYAAFGPVMNLLGWSGSQPSDAKENPPAQEGPKEEDPPTTNSETTQETTTTTASVSPDAPPDPAFDKLLPELQKRTSVPIVLPAKLPDELAKPALDGNRGEGWGALGYGIAFSFGPKEIVAKVSNAETLGTLSANPKEEDRSNEFFDAERIERLTLPDGTEATLRYMVSAGKAGSQGPFWEGKFDKDGFTYDLIVKPNEITEEEVKQALSTMVEVPQEEGSSKERTAPYTPSSSDLQTRAEEAARDYYRAAGSEDWGYTYGYLASETQALFTKKEWSRKNQWLANNSPAVYHVLSVDLEDASGEPVAEVAVRLTSEDGSSSIRNTQFVLESGVWKHRFTQEEKDLFMPGVSFEEFVEAQ